MPAGWVEGRAVCDNLHVGIFLLENNVENKRKKKKRQTLDLMYESIHCVFIASAAVVASLVAPQLLLLLKISEEAQRKRQSGSRLFTVGVHEAVETE